MWVTIRRFISKERESICLQEESVLPLRGAAARVRPPSGAGLGWQEGEEMR